jgi:protein TonB
VALGHPPEPEPEPELDPDPFVEPDDEEEEDPDPEPPLLAPPLLLEECVPPLLEEFPPLLPLPVPDDPPGPNSWSRGL